MLVKKMQYCPFKGRSSELPADQWHWNHLLNPHRTIVENVLARITKFNVLQHKYHGVSADHKKLFGICAQIAQLDIYFTTHCVWTSWSIQNGTLGLVTLRNKPTRI
jgi:hypothetical protein